VRLIDLLFEDAADDARKKGLTSSGFGYWKDKSGKVVARTVDGKLVPVKDDEPAATKSSNNDEVPTAKPTGTSAKAAGTAPDNTVRPQDVEKAAGKETGKEEPTGADGETKEPPKPVVPRNPFRPMDIKVGRPVDHTELKDKPAKIPLDKPMVIGETPVVMSKDEWFEFFTAYEMDNLKTTMAKLASEDAMLQHRNWRNKLDPTTRSQLHKVQYDWQSSGLYSMPKDKKERINNFISTLAEKTKPTMNLEYPVERGMRISDPKTAEQFLSAFRIGEKVDLPASGFSVDPQVARGFADTSRKDAIGVLIRLAPNRKGQLKGIHLHGTKSDYDSEKEVIIPPSKNARCIDVKKLVRDDENGSSVCYVIDLEDQDESLTEDMKTETKNPVFEKIMNTSFGEWAPKSSKLSTMVRDIK
jgi:hypothetical protein